MTIIRAKADRADAAEFHWFASSVLNWRVGYDLAEVLADMRKLNRSSEVGRRKGAKAETHADVVIYRVPGPKDAGYKINNYAPVVDGVECVGHADLRFEN